MTQGQLSQSPLARTVASVAARGRHGARLQRSDTAREGPDAAPGLLEQVNSRPRPRSGARRVRRWPDWAALRAAPAAADLDVSVDREAPRDHSAHRRQGRGAPREHWGCCRRSPVGSATAYSVTRGSSSSSRRGWRDALGTPRSAPRGPRSAQSPLRSTAEPPLSTYVETFSSYVGALGVLRGELGEVRREPSRASKGLGVVRAAVGVLRGEGSSACQAEGSAEPREGVGEARQALGEAPQGARHASPRARRTWPRARRSSKRARREPERALRAKQGPFAAREGGSGASKPRQRAHKGSLARYKARDPSAKGFFVGAKAGIRKRTRSA